MKNFYENVKKIFRHNQFLIVAVFIAIVFGLYMFGCESSVKSPISNKTVTRAQLNIEVDSMLANVELAVIDLDKQDAVRAKLFEIGTVLAQGGTVNPSGAVLSILSIIGIGAVADNRKKDSVIKTLQNNTKS